MNKHLSTISTLEAHQTLINELIATLEEVSKGKCELKVIPLPEPALAQIGKSMGMLDNAKEHLKNASAELEAIDD